MAMREKSTAGSHLAKFKLLTSPKELGSPLSILAKIILGACVFLGIYILFYKLGTAPFDNWDEAWYAEATKQMLHTKEFIVLQWNQTAWLDKPPLFIWLAAGVSSIIGLSEFSIRFISALSAAIIMILVLNYSYRNYGFVPALLAFSTLMLNNIFIWRARSGNLDLLSTLEVVLVFFLLISKLKHKYVLLGFVFACLYLTKASLVLFPFSIFILHEILYERSYFRERLKEYGKLVVVAISFPALWLLLGFIKMGITFPEYYLFKADQGVSHISFLKFNSDYVSFLYYSLQRRFTYVLIIGSLFALRYIKDKKLFLLLFFGGALLLQLSFTERSNNWYLIPAMPFWSMLIAYGCYQISKLFKNNVLILVGIVGLTFYVSYKTFTGNILPILSSNATAKQAESSRRLTTLMRKDEVVVRLDHLYPVTIYYGDRKVVASPVGDYTTRTIFMNRTDLGKAVKHKKIVWFIGLDKDVDEVQKQILPLKIKKIRVNDEETIGKIIQ